MAKDGLSIAAKDTISVAIESRADAVEIVAEAEGVLSAPIKSAEVSSSADGIELLSTDGLMVCSAVYLQLVVVLSTTVSLMV